MSRLVRGLALAAVMVGGGLLTAAPASAAEAVLKVNDEAGLFSADGVRKAQAAFEAAGFQEKTTFVVHTIKSVPAAKQAELDAVRNDPAARGRFFADLAREMARREGKTADVYALVFDNGKAYIARVVTDRRTDVGRGFHDAQAAEVREKFDAGLKTVFAGKLTGDAAKKEMDAALLSAAEYVAVQLKDTTAPAAANRAGGNAVVVDEDAEVGHGRGSGIMGYVCIGLCALLGVWLVVGLVRAFSGGGGGGGGYGGGGGGGGFMTSMLGGLFGAAAGMYLYNSFMGGHSSDMGSTAAAADGGMGDAGDGDYTGGADGGGDGGGDWGGDAGGGDFGGGDWGGGGDFGGGGDW